MERVMDDGGLKEMLMLSDSDFLRGLKTRSQDYVMIVRVMNERIEQIAQRQAELLALRAVAEKARIFLENIAYGSYESEGQANDDLRAALEALAKG